MKLFDALTFIDYKGQKVMQVVSHWKATKYFVKCSHCGYEIFIGGKHTAPKECPKCGCLMLEVKEEK